MADTPKKVRFSFSSKYLGGHTALGKNRSGALVLSIHAIGIGSYAPEPQKAVLQWSDVEYVEVSSSSQTSGIGGLISTRQKTTVAVHSQDGQIAYYEVEAPESQVKAKISPILHYAKISEGKSSNTKKETQDSADEIKKLAKLKNEGILTQEEFDAKKKQILNL